MSLAVHNLGVLLRAPRTWVLAPLARPGRERRTLSSSPASSPAPAPAVSESGRRVLESPFGKDLLPPKDTLIQHLWKDGCVWEEKQFLTCVESGSSYTYAQARRLSHGVARALAGGLGGLQRGLAKGDVVAVVAPNTPEYVFAAHGAIEAGLTVTFVNPLYTPEETGRQLAMSGAKLVATVPGLLPLVRVVAQQLPDYRGTVLLDQQPSEQPAGAGGVLEFSLQALAAEGLATEGVALPHCHPDDVAILPFSSGTTGMPKGVMLTHSQLVSNLLMTMDKEIRFARYTKGDVQDVLLSVLPFFHIFGFNTVLHTTMLSGQHLLTMPKFTPESYIGALLRHRPTGLAAVPAVVQFLAMHPAVKPEHLASVRYVMCGAAPLSLEMLQRLNERVGREVDLRQGYGMTETAPVSLMCGRSTPLERRGSVGQLLRGTRARIVDLGTGQDLGPNQRGELLIKGPLVMSGYYKNEEATREVLDEEGWLHTGDVAYYDEEEYFHIVDRTKELIKVKGHQVSPTELEGIIHQVPGVADSAVVGAPNERHGEVPVAFVVLQPGSKLSAEEIISFVEPKVAPFKRITGVKFVDAIPRNAGGKVLRTELKAIWSK